MSLYLGENLVSGVATPIEGARNIGQIIQSTIPLTDAGLHLLDGSVINGVGSYSAFVTYIAGLVSSYPNLFTTEANWQTSITNYGVCGKYVYDSVNNTVRLPKYNDKIWSGGGTVGVKGDGKAMGWSNGSTEFGSVFSSGTTGQQISLQTTGVGVDNGTVVSVGTSVANQTVVGLSKDPTKTHIIADLSTITTALDDYYYIVVATSTKTDIQVDIDEIATDLNGKADVDLSNCSKPHIVETYVNGTSWYRVYSDGWCEQGGINNSGNTSISLIKAYNNTNYIILSVPTGGTSMRNYGYTSTNYKTGVDFKVSETSFQDSNCWLAMGYIS